MSLKTKMTIQYSENRFSTHLYCDTNLFRFSWATRFENIFTMIMLLCFTTGRIDSGETKILITVNTDSHLLK